MLSITPEKQRLKNHLTRKIKHNSTYNKLK